MKTGPATVWLLLFAACAGAPKTRVSPAEAAAIEQNVRGLLDTIARDLARDGPNGWLSHFVPGDEFFMATDGKLAFANFAHATALVQRMAQQLGPMQMYWSEVRVQPLAEGLATFGATYAEDVQQKTGGQMHFAGYVTGVAVQAASGWQLQSLHWSSPMPGQHQP
ncbi:MAG: nuclear transport factor 2 family protein [Planctomycetota bacterium]